MNSQLFKLLMDNKKTQRIHNNARNVLAKGTEATLYVYDVIVGSDIEAEWFGGISAPALAKQIRELDVDVIHLRINSPGGDVFGARTIEAALRDSKAEVIAYVDGIAASAASFLMLAASRIEMVKGGFIMIHNASTIAYGTANEMEKTVEFLRKVDSSIAESYVARTGMDQKALAKMMDQETWLSADEALDMKFIDQISDDKVKNSAKWNLSAYENAPETPPAEQEKVIVEEPSPNPEPAPKTAAAPEQPDNSTQDHLLRNLRLVLATA